MRIFRLLLLVSCAGCAAFYPPHDSKFKPEPRGEKTVKELLTEPTAPPPNTTITKLTLHLLPRIGMAGGAARLTCRVPRREPHRKLRMNIEGVSASEFDLEGASARVTYVLYVDKVPCGTFVVSCTVLSNDGRAEYQRSDLTMRGTCNEGAE